MNHLHKIKAQLIDQKLDAVLISSPANLFYIAGFVCLAPSEREAYILVTKNQSFLITSPLYANDHELPEGIVLRKLNDASHEEEVINLLHEHRIKHLGFEEHFLSVFEHHHLKTEHVSLVPVKLTNLRVKKNDLEISNIEKACKIGDEAFNFVLEIIKSGITEIELAMEIEIFVRKKGAQMSFPTIVGFGKNAAIPHHVTSNYALKPDNFVLMDFGIKINGYCSDMTRTVYFGKITDEEKKIYQAVLDAQEKAIEFIKNSGNEVKASDADELSRSHIISQGFPNFPHTLGHGIGIEVHERPSLSAHSKDILTTGMVFSVEPGIYLTGKTGVRIEDLMVIEPKGPKLITKSPKNLIII